ncbi:RluA family pseudouridine synthase [Cohnella lubricantis]|uniref:Pseudouridine synthase n=1 Tax=Cohnella lubricantis TaxID=2163172 RepID=A0A841TAA6_9BACL|nr:RluA family pseudouridine synthase [Cohnella lubricantis]MBB6676969.1 RluA family pseudouridine synthase [Cohnella lubricantis]MBP2118374.1 23S rRNA pseudouridine955/2504/2580 synthase [Cohnella lubricantis]
MITRKITASESGKRLHRYLRNLMPNIPLGQIYKMIDQGKAKVNGKRKNQNYELAAGDELMLYVDETQYAEASKGQKKTKYVGVNANIDVIYEDDQLLVVYKPTGVLTHPDRTDQKDTLINRVHAYLYRKGDLDSPLFMPATANRLDRNTSGLVLVGKTAGMLHQLNQWIQKHELQKYYVTIVEGKLEGEGTLAENLVRDERGNRTRVASDAAAASAQKRGGGAEPQEKTAVTHYRSLQSGRGYSLIEVELVSGRTHQIRAHFQSIGHSLLGDVKYGGKPYAGVNHQMLHAWRIVLPDGREFRAPLPEQMREIIERAGLSANALANL